MTLLLRLAACAVFAAVGSLHAIGQDRVASDQIVLQAKKCLKLPGAISYQSYRAVLTATFEDGTAIEVRAAELDPPGEAGRSVLAAAKRAIERCGPYPNAVDGEHRLFFESEE